MKRILATVINNCFTFCMVFLIENLPKNATVKCLAVAVLLISHAACFNSFLKSETVTRSEMVGSWVITEDSLALMKKERICCTKKKVRMILLENGSFELINMPDCFEDGFGRCSGRLLSRKGKWKLWRLNDSDRYSLLLIMSNNTSTTMSIRKGRDLYIGYVFGDADQSHSYFLMKEKENNNISEKQ